MALTRYRLPASGAAGASPAFQTYTHTNSVRRPLPTSDATALATQAYTPDAADHGGAGDSHHVQFVSDALPVGTVYDVGNTIKMAVQGSEPHANNNLNVQLWVGVYNNDGSILRETLRGKIENATELTTSLVNRFISTTVATAYTTVSGDRLVIEASVEGSPGGGGGVQGHNASLRWGADGAGGDLGENDTDTGTTLNPWFEIEETTVTPTRGRVSWVELETPFVPTRGRVSWAELEVAFVPTRGRVSHVEFETPFAPTRGRASWAEFEVPSLGPQPTRGRVSFVEMEVPFAPTRGRASFVALEVPFVATRGRVSWIELQVPNVGGAGGGPPYRHVTIAIGLRI